MMLRALVAMMAHSSSALINYSWSQMADDFNDNSLDLNRWVKGVPDATQNTGVTVVETSSKIVVTPLTSHIGNAFNGLQSRLTYDFTDKSVTVDIAPASTHPSSQELRFGIYVDSNNFATFSVVGTVGVIRVRAGGSNSDAGFTYNSTTMRYMRITHHSGIGKMFFLVSPDGADWTLLRSVSTPFTITSVKPYFWAGTQTSEAVPVVVNFDNFNAGDLTPASGTIDDNFNDNSTNTSQWDIGTPGAPFTQDALVTVAETGGQVVITPRTSFASAAYNGYVSDATYNLTSKSAQIEAAGVLAATAGCDQRFVLYLDSNNYVHIAFGSTGLAFRIRTGGTNSETSTTYDATAHRFWKFEHNGTNLLFRTSPDGFSWFTQRTVTPSWSITALKVALLAGTFSSIASPGTAVFDNFVSNF